MPVRVIVPFAHRHPDTAAALPTHTEWFDVTSSNHAYWEVMADVWADGETFVVVEHDVVIHDQVLAHFEACPEPWCVFPYNNMCHWECMEAWANMLGCTRFSAELIAAVPDAVSSIPEDQRDWHNLCDSIAGDKVGGMPAPLRLQSVRAAGFTHHWHYPPIHHDHGDPNIAIDWPTIMERQNV